MTGRSNAMQLPELQLQPTYLKNPLILSSGNNTACLEPYNKPSTADGTAKRRKRAKVYLK